MENIAKDKASTEGNFTQAYGGEECCRRTRSHDEGNIRVDRGFVLSRQEV